MAIYSAVPQYSYS